MSLVPRLPRLHFPWVDVHIPSMVLYYALWLVGLTVVLRWGFTCIGEFTMFSYVSSYIVIALAVAVPVLWAVVMSFSRFISNKKDVLTAQKKAKLDGTTVVDTVNAELATKYWFGYLVIGVLGAVVSAVIGLFVTDILAGRGIVNGAEELAFCATAVSFIIGTIADLKIFNKLGDVAYLLRVEQGAVEAFLNGGEATEPAEDVKEADSVDILLNELGKVLRKK